MNSFLSIIIPTYNRVNLIGQTLDSILAQSFKNWECIVVDDGSSDDTLELLKSYQSRDKRISYYSRPYELPKGANSCRNFGFEKSQGNWIKWFDSDDVFETDAFRKIVMATSSEFDLIVSSMKYVDQNLNYIDKKHNYRSDNIIYDYLLNNISYYICTPTWNKRFLMKQKTLFDVTLSNLDDWDFNLRMLYKNPTIAFVDDEMIWYRKHKESLSLEIDKLNFEEILSEFRARYKHLSILKDNFPEYTLDFKIFIKNRYKYILREFLIRNKRKSSYFLKHLLKKQLELNDFIGMSRTIFGFVSFYFFKRGYRFLK